MRTALYEHHQALGAKIVDFCGWEMPVQYQGIIQEHQSVRNAVGIFDVSHMGRILVKGKDAEAFLDYLSTNRISGKPDGSAAYTVWCHSEGGCVDDVIVYRESQEQYFVIVNAGNRLKDFEHMLREAKDFDVAIRDRFKEDGILAVQGPNAKPLASELFPQCRDLKNMHFASPEYKGTPIILSATGYTGAGGVEIYAPHEIIVELWDRFLQAGQKYGIAPAGLGARDTLRLEMGYALYGHEISESIAPTESVSAWTVKWDKGDFLGKAALQDLNLNPGKRSEYGIILADKGIAREGYEVFKNGRHIGVVTSGTHSPTLNQSVGIVLVSCSLQEGEEIEVEIRKKMCRGLVVALPFLKTSLKS